MYGKAAAAAAAATNRKRHASPNKTTKPVGQRGREVWYCTLLHALWHVLSPPPPSALGPWWGSFVETSAAADLRGSCVGPHLCTPFSYTHTHTLPSSAHGTRAGVPGVLPCIPLCGTFPFSVASPHPLSHPCPEQVPQSTRGRCRPAQLPGPARAAAAAALCVVACVLASWHCGHLLHHSSKAALCGRTMGEQVLS
jgi:hypothetical protein